MSEDPNRIDHEEVDRLLAEQRQERLVRRRNTVLVIAGVAIVVLLLASLIVWRVRNAKSEAEEKVTPTVAVKVAKAEKGAIAAPVTAVGTIWPREKADVGAKISAQIKSMALLKNKLVRAGQIIAVLESRDLRAQRAEAAGALNEARANERSVVTGTIPQTNAENQKALNDARAKVNNARALYERRQALYQRGGISKKDLEASQLDLTTAEDELRLQEQTVALRARSLNPNDRALATARTAQAEQHLATLDAQLSYATIRAPITGIVTDQFQYEGEFASAGGKLVTIADTSTVIVKAPFSDTAVAQLKTGDAATVTPTDASAEEMHGQVTLLSRSSDPANRTVEVWVTLGNEDGKLRANGAAQVTIAANSKNDAILVPSSAVSLETSDATEGTLMVVDNQKVAHETKVGIGIRTPDKIEIVSGLKGGETVVVEGNYALADGTKVEPQMNADDTDKKDEGEKKESGEDDKKSGADDKKSGDKEP
jgi:multidrug efflux pump subunit AcrA (membrane-fusion protein)